MNKTNNNYNVIDMNERTEECRQKGHIWVLSGFYQYNPHLWCSNCGLYLDQNDIDKESLTELFHNLLKNDNPKGYYIN